MNRRDRPGWAEPVPDPGRHIVRCPGCGQLMSWRRYLEHGPRCNGDEESETPKRAS